VGGCPLKGLGGLGWLGGLWLLAWMWAMGGLWRFNYPGTIRELSGIWGGQTGWVGLGWAGLDCPLPPIHSPHPRPSSSHS